MYKYLNYKMDHSSETTTDVTSTFEGRVKWFNNKAGYGFITDNSANDIFVHHTSLLVTSEQYKYLVQGEYVEFKVIKTTNSKYEYQADQVRGIKGGKLMCETRNEFKSERSIYKTAVKTEIDELAWNVVSKKRII